HNFLLSLCAGIARPRSRACAPKYACQLVFICTAGAGLHGRSSSLRVPEGRPIQNTPIHTKPHPKQQACAASSLRCDVLASDDPRSGAPRGSASIVPRHSVMFLCGAFIPWVRSGSQLGLAPSGTDAMLREQRAHWGRKAMTVAKLRGVQGADMPAGRLVRGRSSAARALPEGRAHGEEPSPPQPCHPRVRRHGSRSSPPSIVLLTDCTNHHIDIDSVRVGSTLR